MTDGEHEAEMPKSQPVFSIQSAAANRVCAHNSPLLAHANPDSEQSCGLRKKEARRPTRVAARKNRRPAARIDATRGLDLQEIAVAVQGLASDFEKNSPHSGAELRTLKKKRAADRRARPLARDRRPAARIDATRRSDLEEIAVAVQGLAADFEKNKPTLRSRASDFEKKEAPRQPRAARLGRSQAGRRDRGEPSFGL